ncbi:hypothetical protein ACFQHO_48740 [Actinomadura yumaensis]|nr:hypothetical protein [Actinomadura sp. J1-007]
MTVDGPPELVAELARLADRCCMLSRFGARVGAVMLALPEC